MTLRNLHRVLLLVVITFPLTGCLFRSHKVQPREVSKAPLKTATQAELIEYVNTQAARVQSMQATVDIDTSVGGVKKGKVTDYKQIRGYVLARKPAMLRMIGLLPIVRNRAFDMVSDGQVFKLWIPPKNRFIIGRNDIETHNIQQPLENLRPQQIYDALLLPPIDEKNEIAVVENSTKRPFELRIGPHESPLPPAGGGWEGSRTETSCKGAAEMEHVQTSSAHRAACHPDERMSFINICRITGV